MKRRQPVSPVRRCYEDNLITEQQIDISIAHIAQTPDTDELIHLNQSWLFTQNQCH